MTIEPEKLPILIQFPTIGYFKFKKVKVHILDNLTFS